MFLADVDNYFERNYELTELKISLSKELSFNVSLIRE